MEPGAVVPYPFITSPIIFASTNLFVVPAGSSASGDYVVCC